ncbi:uncharacterized protein TNCV_835601 [Trichonephila clavipes]|nr:uncharacterized protein TNCV_835601 [Trichonephila clavipes]
MEGEKVTLGGRKQGSLTDKNITKLQNYYRKAIKGNVPDTDKMKTAIYASLMHCSSTDKKPMHGKCPEGESSWCFYKRAIAKASDTILERCVAEQDAKFEMKVCIAAFGENAQKRYSSPKGGWK